MYTQSALGRAIGTKVACIASVAFLMVTGISQADTWTGAGPDNNWSTNGNWLDGSPPTPADSVIFNVGDSGGTNDVDTFFTILGLEYIGNGVHTTSVTSGNQLQINDTASVGIGDGSNGGTATWVGTGTIAIGSSGDPQTLRIGVNTTTSGVMTGTLSAEDDVLNVNLQLNDLVVGSSVGGAATGTLRWNQTEAIQANRVIFGNGRGSTGILDVPTGGSFLLGTTSERIGELDIAYDATGSGITGTTTSADLDFTVTNPTFEAYIGNDLTIGRKTLSNGENTVVGALTLGSNSLLDVGTVAAPANVRIGANSDTGSNVTGELDALESAATVNLQLNDLVVGSSVGGAATGTLRWNQTEAIQANRVIFGTSRGSTGILDVPTGGSFLLGTTSERIGELDIALDATTSGVTGTTTSADLDFTVTNPTFEAYIGNDLTIGRKTLVERREHGGGRTHAGQQLAAGRGHGGSTGERSHWF